MAGIQPGRRPDRDRGARRLLRPGRTRGARVALIPGRLDWTAGQADAGRRLDVALAARSEIGSRAAAQRLVDRGRVTVDGRRRPKGHRLTPGEQIEVSVPIDRIEARADDGERAPHQIAYEDEDLIVVDKPAGVVVHPAPGHPSGTLVQALADRAAGGGEGRPGIVHRLDRDTSGLMVVAKCEHAHRALADALRRRSMRREYIALVDGRPARSGTIDAPIGRGRAHRTVMSTRTDRPRPARTHFELLEALPASTLVTVWLETGRTHQIRAHFGAIGNPVLGDREYGGDVGRLGLERQFLHSARLSFPHPREDRVVDCSSELPDDLSRALEAARGEARETR